MQLSPVLGTSKQLQPQFSKHFASLWRRQGRPPRIGLAISGGVDSMALAGLCRSHLESGPKNLEFHAFIVDHRLRENSLEEAQNVKRELEKSKIEASILTLDWSFLGNPVTLEHLETLARNLRYHAIAKACTDRSIRTLLLAHHADDQAETVLARMVNGYHGSGLRGMKTVATLPVVPDVCGPGGCDIVKPAGKPAVSCLVPIAGSGGMTALRPLLEFRKQDLVEFCRASKLSWFEDHTNADPTFAMRNAIRHLQKQKVLPPALQTPRLLQVSAKNIELDASLEQRAEIVFKTISLSLNTTTGEAIAYGEIKALNAPAENAKEHRLQLLVIRRLAMLVAPLTNIELSDLANTIHMFHSRDAGTKRNASIVSALDGYQVAGIHFGHYWDKHEKRPHLSLRRANPTQAETTEKHLALQSTVESARPFAEQSQEDVYRVRETSLPPKWDSGWRLWDDRFWIRVCSNNATLQEGQSMNVRFLTPDLLGGLRKAAKTLKRPQHKRLAYMLDHASGPTRFTLPAIVIESSPSTPENGVNSTFVAALPSLGWCSPGWSPRFAAEDASTSKPTTWIYEIKYKNVDVVPGKKHKVVHGLEKYPPARLKKEWKAHERSRKAKAKASRGGHGDDGSDIAYAMYDGAGDDGDDGGDGGNWGDDGFW